MPESARVERKQKVAEVRRDKDELDQFDPVRWVERGYVSARFGCIPVLITPELATQIRTFREEQR
jgi:hypothetical protein